LFNSFANEFKNPSPGSVTTWFSLVFVAAGIGLFYLVIAAFFNRTDIWIGNGKFIVKHGPLPWKGNKVIDTMEITQLFCDEIVSRSEDSTTTKYRLNAVLRNGRKEVLVAAGIERDQALYIEKAAENRLGIAPAPVVGELS
jgi:hypothetical protein